MKTCDAFINDKTQPKALRKFLLFKRIPANWSCRWVERGWPVPVLFATLPKHRGIGGGYKKGFRVRVTMASRFGDVGITRNLEQSHGYYDRVAVEQLTNFSEAP